MLNTPKTDYLYIVDESKKSTSLDSNLENVKVACHLKRKWT